MVFRKVEDDILTPLQMNPTPTDNSLNRRFTTFGHALLFVLGFSLVFIVVWGGAATALGQLFRFNSYYIGKIGGVIVILFGLFTLRIIRIPWFYYDTRPQWVPPESGGLLSSILMGIIFAAGWTPCVGSTLGAILAMGASEQSSWQAIVLSSGYALGMGVPFILIGFGMDRAVRLVVRFRRYVRIIEIASGLLLIAVGILMVTSRMNLIASWALSNGLFIDLPLGQTATPSYFISILAGLLSFLSPCVLPLVPAYIGYLSGQAVRSPSLKEVNG
jgi:cytochrome c-type biogenesis protein